MKAKLMVNWRGKEILTVEELDERIDARIDEVKQDTELYDEYLEDCLDFEYTKRELFDVLSGSDDDREEVITEIRSRVAEAIYDWVKGDISADYEEVTIEV